MVTHYSQALGTSSCGRTGSTLTITQERGKVSCKTCLRSMEKAVTAPQTKSVYTSAKQPHLQRSVARGTPKLIARACWGNRLAQMPGRNRMPRGRAQQLYI
ncbi:hypothetical protein ALQ79_200073 [Pseudomonas amygdali pv. lachrymans]|nr:hypothetical protein ALQ79_200073 [Pseudomonas amygdali pv. lachrymans]